MALLDKINATLLKLGVNAQVVELAKAPTGATSGTTSGATSGTTTNLPSAIVDEIIPQTIKISYSAVGAPVIATDADGKEENIMDGDYVLVSGQVLVVKDGKLADLKPAEEMTPEAMSGGTSGNTSGDTMMSLAELKLAVEEIELACKKKDITAEDQTALACKKKKLLAQIESKTKLEEQELEMKKYPWDKCIADNTAKYGADGAAKICGSIKAKGTKMSAEDVDEFIQLGMSIEKQRISDIIDLSKNGNYTLEISVSDGAITYGTLYTNTYQNLMLEKETEIEGKITELTEAFEAKISGLEKVNEALKTGETKTVAPVASDVKLSKSDLLKLDIQEKINKNKI